ncbi:ferritin-like domain-containing protein [Christiangramia echinicola]|uniref:Ferritin-like domain-containing protein n=1 Tax=Christiangramia echinicola TaxID=279359 RepID=A0A1H1KXX0_9FLAO|nr:ferritin-like domain-containing protein [Christiangramia echinicola]SDR67096.1 Ferritin-like domain-containing protein [Christiangramia echinicola]
MSIIKLLDEFTSEKLTTKSSSRREMFSTLSSFGKKAAMAAVPFGLATNKASAAAFFQENPAVDALQLALTLEYLEAEFYMKALDSGVLNGNQRAMDAYMQISKHEDAHVAFLKAGLEGAGATPVESPTFDFTAGGAFDPFNDNGIGQETAYAQLLALAQAFEDTGVRAYKGQAGNLMGTAFLEPALQIHSVEARHASEIRQIRGVEGWITGNGDNAAAPANSETAQNAYAAVYEGEGNTMQGGLDLTTDITYASEIVGDLNAAVTQAFDEPITAEQATAIASLFIVSDSDGDDSDG